MLHNIYSKLAAKVLTNKTVPWHPPATLQMCGDDEIAIGMTWDDAIRYIWAHEDQAHKIQHRKVMLSDRHGEFLQYNMSADEHTIPVQPLAPAINNFVSGSWYKTSAYNPTQYPQQVAEAAASTIRRGARQETMLGLCMATCNWLCQGLNWRTMLMATNVFGATKMNPESVRHERTTAITLANQTRPSGAAEYATLVRSRFSLSQTEIETVQQFVAENIFASYQADTRNTTWEQSSGDATQKMTIPQDIQLPTTLKKQWMVQAAEQHYDPMTWMAVQLGIPLQLVKRIGMQVLIKRATNQQRAHINMPTKPQLPSLQPTQFAKLPGAIAPYFAITTAHRDTTS
jgi:hypothetical protein